MFVVLLDSYHLGDPLFVSQLARDVAARKEGLVLVHGSGEAGERALEARGFLPEATDGVWAVRSADEAADVERATRDFNRRLVHEMNEAGAPAVRVMGADRGLLTRGPDGTVGTGRTAWLSTLVAQGGVAVVGALVAAEGDAALSEIDAAAAAAALAEAIGAEAVVLLATGRAPASPEAMTVADAASMLPDRALAERLVGASRVPVVVVGAAQLREPGDPAGTRLVA